MSDRLTDAELDRLEEARSLATIPGPWAADGAMVVSMGDGIFPRYCHFAQDDTDAYYIAAAHNALPALLAEVREHRAREAAHRAALDALVDGDGR